MAVLVASNYEKYGRKCYEKHKEKYLEASKLYYQQTGKEAKKLAYPDKWQRVIFQRYGITEEQYNDRLENQLGVCKICNKPPKEGKRLDVDHCHNTKQVRGLLCNNCNRALGHFKDSVGNLLKAIEYLNCDITGKGGSCGV